MTTSNKVVGLSLFAVLVVAIDFVSAWKQQDQRACEPSPDFSAAFVIPNLAPASHSLNEQFNNLHPGQNVAHMSDSLSTQQCLQPEYHQVSWYDWLFSDADSATFHYLDLLELISSSKDRENTQRPQTQ